MALANGPDGPNRPNGQSGCATVYPVGLRGAVWCGAGGRCAGGVCWFDGNGGVRVAVVWRLHKTYKTYKTYKIMIGAPLYTPRGGRALCGMAQGGQIYRWGMLAFLMATVVCVLRGRGAGVRPV